MAIQLQLRKGTKVQNDAFTGAEAELTYDSTSKGLRLHDGVQQGGYEVPVLVSVQRPTAENNYTWFRVWSDGWVEQGGFIDKGADDTSSGFQIIANLPITMANTMYYKNIIPGGNTSGNGYMGYSCVDTTNSTTTALYGYWIKTETSVRYFYWQVSGMRA